VTATAFNLRADEELKWDDHFCGAGGETTGIRMVSGIRVVHAANHDPVAIATHSHNYSDIEHSLADIPSMDPTRIPKGHVLWSSPECKARSYASGRPKDDPSLFDPRGDKTAERSRATMDEVWRFAEANRYLVIVVENVPQVVDWCEPSQTHHSEKCNCGVTFRRWLRDGANLGYRRRRFLFLNSMLFPPTPQSRDRFYGVFVLDGVPFPDLDHTCLALCAEHGVVSADQRAKAHLKPPGPVRKSWGPLDTVWGRYGQQYIYTCPTCGERAEPAITPAATAIEWWRDPGPRIGERAERGMKPLEEGTIERVGRGILRLPGRPMVVPLHRLTDPSSRRARDVDDVLATLTAQQRDALIVQVAGNLGRVQADGSIDRAAPRKVWSIEEVLRTIHGSFDRGLIVPGRENAVPASLDAAALPTCTTINSLYQLTFPWVEAGQDGNQPKAAAAEPLDAFTIVWCNRALEAQTSIFDAIEAVA
jgi:DNA (cytosine-5)-methyltransferase 1